MALGSIFHSETNFWFNRKTDPHQPMWIDMPTAQIEVHKRSCDTAIENVIRALIIDGFAVIPRNIPADVCDAVIGEFTEYCKAYPEHANFSNKYGLHDRLCNFHLTSTAARSIAKNKTVRRIVQTCFGEPEAVAGSLFFERGSQQSVHRDTPAFFTQPLNHYFGVWHALEDIDPDSGALVYYPGGHRVAPDRDFMGIGYDRMDDYFKGVRRACEDAGLVLRSFTAKKGDTLIWHPSLPHGGGPIVDMSKSRRSIVFHYVPEQSPMWGPHEFFGPVIIRERKRNMKAIELGDGLVGYDWGAPMFLKNEENGNFKD